MDPYRDEGVGVRMLLLFIDAWRLRPGPGLSVTLSRERAPKFQPPSSVMLASRVSFNAPRELLAQQYFVNANILSRLSGLL